MLRFFYFSYSLLLFAAVGFAKDEDLAIEDRIIKRIDLHFIVKDYDSARIELTEALQGSPHSAALWKRKVDLCCFLKQENKAFECLDQLLKLDPNSLYKQELLEKIAWVSIIKGTEAHQLKTQVFGLISAALTQQSQAAELIKACLHSYNYTVRRLGVYLAGNCGYAELSKEIIELLRKEKNLEVLEETMHAIGLLSIEEAAPIIKELLLKRDNLPLKIRKEGMRALVQLLKHLPSNELSVLLKNEASLMRQLACEIIIEYPQQDLIPVILPLTNDRSSEVRVAALTAVGIADIPLNQLEDVLKHLQLAANDIDYRVAITANWALARLGQSCGLNGLKDWLKQEQSAIRLLAAAALAAIGPIAQNAMAEQVDLHTDPYVRANLGLGLIGQRSNLFKAGQHISQVLHSTEQIMIDEETHPIFSILKPSKIALHPFIENYPEVINQITRLNLLNRLSIINFPEFRPLLEKFLKSAQLCINSVSALTLLEEGDDNIVTAIREFLSSSNRKVAIQAALVLALWNQDEQAMLLLQKSYATCDYSTKLQILETIGYTKSSYTIPFLTEVVRLSPFPTLRLVAASSLINSLNS
ncbi:MAG: conserved putative secreted protein [Chlamydiales bacterium]|jgi:HEAT repeat protein|nr:conserved putative secreted protein [Chlamydiales bacterium]